MLILDFLIVEKFKNSIKVGNNSNRYCYVVCNITYNLFLLFFSLSFFPEKKNYNVKRNLFFSSNYYSLIFLADTSIVTKEFN